MDPCPVFPLIGIVTAIGPSMLDKGDEAMRAHVQQRGGRDGR
jgi:hypothetical protein